MESASKQRERETKNYRRSNQTRPGKRDERGEGADAGPARARSEMGSTGPNFSRGEGTWELGVVATASLVLLHRVVPFH